MKSIRNACLFSVLALAAMVSSHAANACSLELNHVYTITPYVDDGLSRAERINCALGELHYYSETDGWREMLDRAGRPLEVLDMSGAVTPVGELLVAILRDNTVALRWRGPGDGRFFANDAGHFAFMALNRNGAFLNGLRIGEVSYDNTLGAVRIGIKTNSDEYCEIVSDAEYVLNWQRDLTCFAIPGTATASDNREAAGRAPSIPVLIGGEPEEDACFASGIVNGSALNQRKMVEILAGPGAQYPVIDEVPVAMALTICETHPSNAWEGVVYPGDMRDCAVSTPLPRQPYFGPCKSGWINARSITVTAG